MSPDTAGISLRDLSTEDKHRIGQLIQRLAQERHEKEACIAELREQGAKAERLELEDREKEACQAELREQAEQLNTLRSECNTRLAHERSLSQRFARSLHLLRVYQQELCAVRVVDPVLENATKESSADTVPGTEPRGSDAAVQTESVAVGSTASTSPSPGKSSEEIQEYQERGKCRGETELGPPGTPLGRGRCEHEQESVSPPTFARSPLLYPREPAAASSSSRAQIRPCEHPKDAQAALEIIGPDRVGGRAESQPLSLPMAQPMLITQKPRVPPERQTLPESEDDESQSAAQLGALGLSQAQITLLRRYLRIQRGTDAYSDTVWDVPVHAPLDCPPRIATAFPHLPATTPGPPQATMAHFRPPSGAFPAQGSPSTAAPVTSGMRASNVVADVPRTTVTNLRAAVAAPSLTSWGPRMDAADHDGRVVVERPGGAPPSSQVINQSGYPTVAAVKSGMRAEDGQPATASLTSVPPRWVIPSRVEDTMLSASSPTCNHPQSMRMSSSSATSGDLWGLHSCGSELGRSTASLEPVTSDRPPRAGRSPAHQASGRSSHVQSVSGDCYESDRSKCSSIQSSSAFSEGHFWPSAAPEPSPADAELRPTSSRQQGMRNVPVVEEAYYGASMFELLDSVESALTPSAASEVSEGLRWSIDASPRFLAARDSRAQCAEEISLLQNELEQLEQRIQGPGHRSNPQLQRELQQLEERVHGSHAFRPRGQAVSSRPADRAGLGPHQPLPRAQPPAGDGSSIGWPAPPQWPSGSGGHEAHKGSTACARGQATTQPRLANPAQRQQNVAQQPQLSEIDDVRSLLQQSYISSRG